MLHTWGPSTAFWGGSLFLTARAQIILVKCPLDLTLLLLQTSQILLGRTQAHTLLCVASRGRPLRADALISASSPAWISQASVGPAQSLCKVREACPQEPGHRTRQMFSAFPMPHCLLPILSTPCKPLGCLICPLIPVLYNLKCNYSSNIISIAFKDKIL